ncbi:MAG: DUF455 domain-containing protein [Armatimonadetes bacterium]|nr:DUF455 domain-containing protein [Armatimonadota bacterium]
MDTLPEGDFQVRASSPDGSADLGDIPIGASFFLRVKNCLDRLEDGKVLEVRTKRLHARDDLRSWCRIKQHQYLGDLEGGTEARHLIRKGERKTPDGLPDWGIRIPLRGDGSLSIRDWFAGRAGRLMENAPAYVGFVPRGTVSEPGVPDYGFTLNRKIDVWADNIAELYEQAKASQWNASTDIPWAELPALPEPAERAVCQIMTFLAENEYSALYIPAKFMARINSHYIEVLMYLSALVQDESRHIEAFIKRAMAGGGGLQYSSVLTERSLHSLFVQEDYFKSSFLLHVLGEGTFLDLLGFIRDHAPDPITEKVVHLARLDEGRHVAYGIAHARHVLAREPGMVRALTDAVEERREYMEAVEGENSHVIEALSVLAGGGDSPERFQEGFRQVENLQKLMYEHRIQRMLQVGIGRETAERISASHTPNFM